ncbi:MAG: hypothetical protein OEV30_11855 [Ignavibacteria bacterium]|nr:hypothetical protein [Ignavibacteria bacterium]
MSTPLYIEEQRFRQPWVWIGIALSIVGLLPLWHGLYQQLGEGIPWGDNPTSDTVLIVVVAGMTLLILGIMIMLLNARLVISITRDQIGYRFRPFHRREHVIRWDEVAKAEIRSYRPIMEYGGWGIRIGAGGRAYNVSGTDGLQLELKDGRKVLFGTQKPHELGAVVQQIGVR